MIFTSGQRKSVDVNAFHAIFCLDTCRWFLYRKYVHKMVQGCSKLQKMCFLTKLVQKVTNYGTVTPAQSHDDLPYRDKSHCQCGTRLGLTDSDSEKRSLCSLDVRWYLYLSTSIWISSVIVTILLNSSWAQYLVDTKTVRNATDIQVSFEQQTRRTNICTTFQP